MTRPVLVVDDHPDARDVLRRYLEHHGYAVTTAIHGEDALAKLATGLRPCLIVLDVMMPVMDGPTFAEHLRQSADRALAETPIVLLTGAYNVDAAKNRSKARDVLTKPVTFQRLTQVVDEHCRR
jgi:CheY-like chemotaxis protein